MTNELPSEKIKQRLSIEDVVSDYIQLQRAGSSLKAICPFHNENSPSFFVSVDKQIFNCFGCGKGGDMFKFIMEIEGVEFVDALRILAKKANIELKRVDPKVITERTVLQDICVEATKFFQKNLNSEKGIEALKYLKKRGLSEEIIEEFRIGYSPNTWDSLYNFLTIKGFSAKDIEKAGLILQSKKYKNKYFDRFRDRVIFPILDVNSYIVGFTGRYLTPKKNEGKYVNSPQTPIFDKSNLLFNLDKAKIHIKKNNFAVLVEGQMDVISLWQDGIKNVVASSGTALTLNQINLLKRYSKNIKVSFDMDDAGVMATKKGIDMLLDAGFNVEILQIPNGKDPADFVLSNKGEFKNLLDKSMPVMEYYFNIAFSKYNKTKIEEKKKIAEEILPHIKKISNQIERYHWLNILSEKIDTDIRFLEEEIKSIKNEGYINPHIKNKEVLNESEEKKYDKIFISLMAFLLKSPGNFSLLKDGDILLILEDNQDEIKNKLSNNLKDLFDFFVECGKIGQISDVLDRVPKNKKDTLNPIILQSEMLSDSLDVEAEIIFLIDKLKSDILKTKRLILNNKIKKAESEGDYDSVLKFLEELNNNITKYGN